MEYKFTSSIHRTQFLIRKTEILSLILVMPYLAGCQHSPVVNESKHGPAVTKTEKAFVRRALDITGLTGQSDITTSICALTPPVKILPFICQKSTVYRIRLDNVRWALNSKTNQYIKSLEVFFAADTHQVLRIQSVWPEGTRGAEYPSLEYVEKNIIMVTDEKYDLPRKPAKVPLREAMKEAIGQESAKQIIIYYILESNQYPIIRPRPVWIINCWGFPPAYLPRPPGVVGPGPSTTHFRTVVDAETGERFYTDNIPTGI